MDYLIFHLFHADEVMPRMQTARTKLMSHYLALIALADGLDLKVVLVCIIRQVNRVYLAHSVKGVSTMRSHI